MAKSEFSDDPNTPLNKKIVELCSWIQEPINIFERMQELCREIYDMGFDDGQAYVWKMRSMEFVDDPENPGKQKTVFPGDPDYPELDEYITVTSSQSCGDTKWMPCDNLFKS